VLREAGLLEVTGTPSLCPLLVRQHPSETDQMRNGLIELEFSIAGEGQRHIAHAGLADKNNSRSEVRIWKRLPRT
jgi:hypothetical protein